MSHVWEEEDWILVATGGSHDFELQTTLQCDLCDRHIPAFILCETCKHNKRPKKEEDIMVEEKIKEEVLIECEICGKKESSLFHCEFCEKKLCRECRFGDDVVQTGVKCCQEKERPKPTFWVHKSHQKLFQEFLSLH